MKRPNTIYEDVRKREISGNRYLWYTLLCLDWLLFTDYFTTVPHHAYLLTFNPISGLKHLIGGDEVIFGIEFKLQIQGADLYY